MFKKLLKLIVPIAGAVIPHATGGLIENDTVQTALNQLCGFAVPVGLTWALGSKFLGQLVSMLGKMKWGSRYDEKIEPTMIYHIDQFKVGLKMDNKK